MNILIASDHAGFELKEFLKSKFPQLIDLGTDSRESVDYPDFADAVASKINAGAAQFGVLICGSGIGICMRANRYPKVRAVQAWNAEIAKLSREHNDANVICFGERAQSKEDCVKFLEIFLNTAFLGDSSIDNGAGSRHLKRVKKLETPIR